MGRHEYTGFETGPDLEFVRHGFGLLLLPFSRLRFGVEGLGLRVWGSGLSIWGLRFGVWSLGFGFKN